MGLRQGETEHAQGGQFLDQGQGNELVPQMPAMGVGGDLRPGEVAELLADRLMGLVQAAGLQGRLTPGGLQQGHDAGLGFGCRVGGQLGDHWGEACGVETEVCGADHLPLAHGQAAGQLAEIFMGQQQGGPQARLVQGARGGELAGPGGGLAQGLHIGGRPGQSMGRMLAGVQGMAVEAASGREPGGERPLGLDEAGLGGFSGGLKTAYGIGR